MALPQPQLADDLLAAAAGGKLSIRMAWIHTVPPEEATGLLRRLYDTAVKRAGKVFNILRIQSPRPKVLDASTRLYLEVMYGESSLTRAQREMIATVVSRANDCHY